MTPEHPEAPPDDRVIGVALRWSLAAAACAGAAIAVWRFMPRPAVPPAPVAPLPQGPASMPAPGAGAAFAFEDATAAWGIDFRRTSGADGRRFLPETMGGGVAVWDLDGDGDLDLLFPDGDAWPDAPAGTPRGQGIAVFRNESSGGRVRFERVRGTGLEQPRPLMGVSLARIGTDPRPEIVATGVGGVRVFRPAGKPSEGLRWTDVTEPVGAAAITGWTTAAAHADFDRDGDLDVVVGRYVEWSPAIDLAVGSTLAGIGRAYGAPTGFEGTSLLFLERGADGAFTDTAAMRGLDVRSAATGKPVCKALGFVVDDVDGDGDLDLFVANDTVRNLLFFNDGRGAFEERGTAAGVAFDRVGAATGAMGCDASHLRNDRALAIAVGNFANEPCSLYVTGGDGRFADDAIVDGISAATRRALTFGVAFLDVDRDGREDLLLANGHIEPRIGEVQPGQRYEQAAQAFRNTGGRGGPTFAEVPAEVLGPLSVPMVGRGLAWGDLDGDGVPDVVEAALDGAPRLLRNATAGGASLVIRLSDQECPGNPDAIGAEVRLVTSDGGELRRTIMPTRSYLSQVPPVAAFGLGPLQAEAIRVRWPDGAETEHRAERQAGETTIRRAR